jgi:carbonic anhydrase
MEILQVLLSLLLNGKNFESFAPILNAFKENDFDLKKVLESIDLKSLMPFITSFLNDKKQSPNVSVGQGFGLSPIAKIADKEIIYSLNQYFHEQI